MKRSMNVLLTLTLLFVFGCNDEERFSRYPSLAVPEYETADYIHDLSSTDPELVYNAVCRLGEKANQFSRILCAKNADPASHKYQNSEKAYQAVCEQLESETPLTVAASLRFLQLFSKNYTAKEELVEMACRIEIDHPQVLFEQATLLNRLVMADTRIPETVLRRLLDCPSWIVTRTTYDLIGKLQNEAMRQELVQRYRETEDERELLILINALRYRLQPEEARLLEEDFLATDSQNIRHATGRVLVLNPTCDGVMHWFHLHYPQFDNEEKHRMFEYCEDIDLACQFIDQGYTPPDKDLQALLKGLLAEKKSDDHADLLRFDEAFGAAPQIAERWKALKDEAAQEQQRMDTLREEINPITKEFTEKLIELQAKHKMSESELKTLRGVISERIKSATDGKKGED